MLGGAVLGTQHRAVYSKQASDQVSCLLNSVALSFFLVFILSVCVSAQVCVCSAYVFRSPWSSEEAGIPLQLELQRVVSYLQVLGNRAWV